MAPSRCAARAKLFGDWRRVLPCRCITRPARSVTGPMRGREHAVALCGDLCRPGARQRDHRAQAGMVVLELELAAMQARDRRGEAQPEPRARLRAALLQ